MELGERAARNHAADFTPSGVSADAAGGGAQAQPDAAALPVDGAGQGAIVDHFAAYGPHPAQALEHFTADEDASARGGGCAAPRAANPGRRIEHEEEEYESGNERTLGQCPAFQGGHERDYVVTAGRRARHQCGEVLGRMHDIGVGEEQVFGRETPGGANAFRGRPEFAGPARGHAAGADHVEKPGGSRGAGGVGRAIGAIVVDQHDMELTRIALPGERADGARDHERLVTRRNHRHNAGCHGRQRTLGRSVAQAPESTAPQQQVNPDGQGCRARQFEKHELALSRV